MSLIRKLAFSYAFLFFAVAAIGILPAFGLQPYDTLLYACSGFWALIAALAPQRQSELYFQLFGPVYLFDGLLGLITGAGCLDGSIVIDGFRSFGDIEFPVRFMANAPHLAIGGLAVLAGFWPQGRVAGNLVPA